MRLRSSIMKASAFKNIAKFGRYGARAPSRCFSVVIDSDVTDFEFSTVVEMQQKACSLYANNKALGTRQGSKYEWITYAQLNEQVELFRSVLKNHNIGRNDKVAVISNNRVEWAVAMYACMSVGAQYVPMYEAQLEKDWRFIVEDSEAKLILAANERIRTIVEEYVGKVGKVSSVLCFDADPEYLHSYKRWMEIAKTEPRIPPSEISPDDVASIIYTSGTTGKPKGVELTHGNISANLLGLKHVWKGQLKHHTSLAFLPWAHVFGQTAELNSLIATGSSLGIVSNREEILECLNIVKPSMMASVPMLFNKVYDGVMKKVSLQSPLKQKLFHFALKCARDVHRAEEYSKPVPLVSLFLYKVLDNIVFSSVRTAMGGNVKFMASGGAAVSLPVLEFFEDIGVPICEGYGLTETSPVITAGANNWVSRRLGCSGVPLFNVDLQILDPYTLQPVPAGEEGEVCVSGPSIMKGYRNNPQANDEVFFQFNGKRFFKTGDLGRLIDGKFLKLTGRIKEQFKLENGKYVVPAPLEDMLVRSRFLAQSYLYGDNRPYTIVLIVPNFLELKPWCLAHNIPYDDNDLAAVLEKPVVAEMLKAELCHMCGLLKSFERPQKFAFLTEPFTQENQMLTPKMSLRRNNVYKKYTDLIQSIYDGKVGIDLPKKPSISVNIE